MDDDKKVKNDVDRILADLETCARALETMRPIVSEDALLQKFKGTDSVNVVIALQDILCRYIVLSICRMWDENKDAQSIPNVMKSIKATGPSNKASRQRIKQIAYKVDKMKKSKKLARLSNWRNKNLGHALEETRKDKEKNGDSIQNPLWGDIFDLESRTCVIVKHLAAAAADIPIDPAEQWQFFSRDAQAFWGSFIDKPR